MIQNGIARVRQNHFCQVLYFFMDVKSGISMGVFWCCFVYQCRSYERDFVLNTSQPVIALSSFGFTQNATFSIDITSARPSRFNIFLANIDRAQLNYRKMRKTCRKNSSDVYLVSGLNYTNKRTSRTVSWNGTIKRRNVYYPIVVNCDRNESVYSLRMRFRNEDSLIDYRETCYSFIYVLFAGIHILLAIVWIINAFLFQQFFIELHCMFTALPILKSLSNMMKAKVWEERRIFEVISTKRLLPIRISQLVYTCCLLSVNSLALRGYGVLHTKYNVRDMLEAVVSSILLAYGIILTESLWSAEGTVIAVSMITAGFVWYIRTIGPHFLALIQVLNKPCHPLLEKKIRLLRNYITTTVVSFSAVLFVQSCALAMDVYSTTETLIYELGLVLEESVQFYFFALRKEYEGVVVEQEDVQIVQIEDPEKTMFVALQDNL